MSVKNANEVRIEKIINTTPKAVFQALSEGRLFSNCGADTEKLKIDFRVGGGYTNFFTNHSITCCGKFLEIIQDRKIVFTWGDVGSDEGFPKTEVLVELTPEAGGKKTKILILHTGFKTQEDADSHDYGWNAGLTDLSTEMTEGRLKLIRTYPVSRDILYSFCSDPRKFFAPVSDVNKGSVDFRVGGKYRFPTTKKEILGEFLEIIPGKKIVFSWLGGCDQLFERPTRVTLEFDDEEDGESSLALTHELLPVDDDSVKTHRHGWEHLTNQLRTLLK